MHRIVPDIRARVVRQAPPLSTALQAEVDVLWEAAQARTGGALFNGLVFSVDEITPHLLSGHMTEFCRIVAQMEQPELHETLRLRPLAVCGVVCCRSGVILGQRAAAAVYQASMWQLPPAGSVDAEAVRPDGSLDLEAQLLRELDEELGLPAASVGRLRPLCMVEHPGSHVLDLGFLLITQYDAAAVLAAHARSGNREYQWVEMVPYRRVSLRIEALGTHIVPAAAVFLRELGLLPARR